jgi:hypothetical protein
MGGVYVLFSLSMYLISNREHPILTHPSRITYVAIATDAYGQPINPRETTGYLQLMALLLQQ